MEQMDQFDKTIQFSFQDLENIKIKEKLSKVFVSLKEKGYNPINQISGYLLSGDPAYIPRHKDARKLIQSIERDEIIEELVKTYLLYHEDEL